MAIDGKASLQRGGLSLRPLTARDVWMPLALDDALEITSGHVSVMIGKTVLPISGPRKVILSREVYKQLMAQIEMNSGLACMRPKGSDPRVGAGVSLLVPERARIYTGDRIEYPAIHWIAGNLVKSVRLKLKASDGKIIWQSSWWKASDRSAMPSALFANLSKVSNPGAIVFLELESDKGTVSRVRCQSSVSGAAKPVTGLYSPAKDPRSFLEFLNGRDGFLKSGYSIEAVDYAMRQGDLMPKSLFVQAVELDLAAKMGLDDWGVVVGKSFDWDTYEHWLSPDVMQL